MDLLANLLHTASISVVGEDYRIAKIRLFVSFFGIDSNQVKMFPYFLKQTIEVKFHIATNNNSVWSLSNHVDLLHRNGINFVVTIQTFNVLSIT